ncbi:protein SMG9 [Bactrocera neohumeralis]|uniref:protein SMG9 n=1 Tax=Bactrocera tryoni TaxID=59916 RepID=UPI001A99CCB7|nr:protein SMG9 [Bactrocera tryoni]XP_050328290.1 protein SMG9 [Bactrocera neohumeralis]
MSDGKRRRYRRVKQTEDKRPIILAKRNVEEDSAGRRNGEAEMQPKILLKSRAEMRDDAEVAETSANASTAPLKTMIVTRSEVAQSPGLSGVSPVTTKEQLHQQTQQANVSGNDVNSATNVHIIEPLPQMTRPATVISSTGAINASTRKLLMKGNTDFLVVGVVGTQGVGKSTIMNILANDDTNYDYYLKLFVEEDSFFPTKLKPHKCSARSRTESTHMFITGDRLILLDSPPVMCNSYRKDMTTNELDDLRQIISFLSVCHLLIVVQDDYFNMNFIRLLQFAEIMKPTQDNKPFVSNYFPNVLFVKNRAKRQDFTTSQKERMDRMLRALFKDSQLRIYKGQTAEQQKQKKTRPTEGERQINTFLLPEVDENHDNSTFHKPLREIIDEFRSLVFMTPRTDMYTGASELTEAIWFELLTKLTQDTQQFFNTYEEIQRKHLEIGNVHIGSQGNSAKDTHENWREQ